MTRLTIHDPFRSAFAWPKWFDEFEDLGHQRGLKIRETEKSIVAEAVVAGVAASEVEVHIEDGVLTIKAQASQDEEEKDSYKSSSFSYYYTAALLNGQWDKAKADVKNGIIKVTIPKTESSKPRKIKVKTEEK